MRQANGGRATLDRREFLTGGAAALVVAGLSPWLVASTDAGTDPTRAAYDALVGEWFEAGGASGEPLQLVAVQPGPASEAFEQYTLVFRSGRGDAIAEGTYDVTPPGGDPVPMFLQQSATADGEPRLRASFAVFRPISPAACAARRAG